jgi:NAD(P)-dependent dehydrogenase (short-subunit alcohol dehydrogenase family)
MSRSFEGAVAFVTGAAQGLGAGMAEELARRGAHVVIADLQQEKAEEAAESIRRSGSAASSVQLDIGDPAGVGDAYDGVVAKHGRLDFAVHNAGVGQHVAPVVELSDAEWQRVIHVTLTGTFYCCRAAARIMERQNAGAIVNIASINGQNPAAWVAAYNVAKAGVISLTRTLALELAAYGVRVNAVCPGPVYTDFNRTVMAERRATLNLSEEQMIERIRAAIPLGRWGEPADIARVVAFLLGPEAAWMTGEVVRVSGGLEGVAAAPARRTS